MNISGNDDDAPTHAKYWVLFGGLVALGAGAGVAVTSHTQAPPAAPVAAPSGPCVEISPNTILVDGKIANLSCPSPATTEVATSTTLATTTSTAPTTTVAETTTTTAAVTTTSTTAPPSTTSTTPPASTTTTSTPSTTTTSPAPPTTVAPSGQAMPTSAPSNFPETVMREDFLVPAAEGQFLSVYQPRGISAYPTSYKDTRSKSVGTSNPLNYGTYDPNIISVPANSGYMQLALRTINGSVRVAAPVPYVDPSNTTNRWHDGKNLRISIRWKSEALPTRKVAWLLWPKSGTNTSGATAGTKDASGAFIGGNGEIDFPESNLDASANIQAFMHWQNGTSGSNQNSYSTTTKTVGGWHTTTYEWMTGVSFKAWVDGALIGSYTGAKVPAEAMHLVLQTETVLSSSTVLQQVTGNVLVDWLTIETKP